MSDKADTNETAENGVPSHAPPIFTLDRRFLANVIDADEEIFTVYSRLAGSTASSMMPGQRDGLNPQNGLGFMNSSSSSLEIELEIRPPADVQARANVKNDFSPRKGRSHKPRPRAQRCETKRIAGTIYQDIYAINHRKGDTGSMVWRASIDFAELLWYNHLYPSTTSNNSLLNMQLFRTSTRILELGSGTGSLAVLTDELFEKGSTATWTLSDQSSLLSTISRNLMSNGLELGRDRSPTRYRIEDIDWFDTEKDWLNRHAVASKGREATYDVILAVDCLYNEALIPPFLHTLDLLAHPASNDGTPATLVLIVSQLRSDDVMRLFIETWIGLPLWSVYRVTEEGLRGDLGLNISHGRYVVWCGWKCVTSDA